MAAPFANLSCIVAIAIFAVVVYQLYFDSLKRNGLGITSQLNASYDYIIVGSGSAGSVLANRLSEDGDVTVLLLEAGGDDRDYYDIKFPSRTSKTFAATDFTRIFFTESQTNVFQGLQDNRSRWPRGRVLGGSSSINGLMYVRGSRHDFDRWSRHTGDPTWDYRHVLAYFKKAERAVDETLKKSPYHGTQGLMPVSVVGKDSKASQKLIEAFKEIGYPYNEDYNGATLEGISESQANEDDGERRTGASAYIHPALDRTNLHVSLHSFVQKVMISSHKRAYGVEVIKDNRKYVVKAKKEVILSAGSVQSPQILMLSGVGPKSHLEELRIPVVADLPVGQNLQDHLFTYVTASLTEPISANEEASDSLWADLQHKLFKSGPLSKHHQENLFFSSTTPETKSLDWPDLELHFFSRRMRSSAMKAVNYDEKLIEELAPFRDSNPHGWVCCPSLLRPNSVGNITLRSRDPFDDPVIRANYLEKQEDVDVLLRGVEVCKRAINSKVMSRVGARLTESRSISLCKQHTFDTPEYWACYIRATPLTIYHPSGTCKMGRADDVTSVVDSQLRVKGVAGLRVIDASVMPYIVSANPHASIVMIAEKISDAIKGRSFLPPEDL